MPLPKIATPTYELELPSTGASIQYRPFLVKEEKVLVIALESEDNKQITTAIKAVLKNCIITKGIKVERLPTFDIEYLFLNIRGKSVGEELEVNIVCPDDETTEVPVTINLDEIKVEKSEDHSNKIKIDSSIMMELKYPSLDQFVDENFNFEKETDNTFSLVASCIEMIFSKEEAWEGKDSTHEELVGFLEQLNSTQFKEVQKFFDTMPKLSHDIEVENPETKVKSTVTLEGLASFFG